MPTTTSSLATAIMLTTATTTTTAAEVETTTRDTSLFVAMSTLFVIFIVGILGNIMVMLVVIKFPKMRSITNLYLFNLAVSDFLFLWGIPITLATFYYEGWIFDEFTCKLFYTVTSSNWFAGVFTITVLSADRYLAICRSSTSSKYRSQKKTHVICLIVWILSIVVMLPIITNANLLENDHYNDTDIDQEENHTSTFYPNTEEDHNNSSLSSSFSDHEDRPSCTIEMIPEIEFLDQEQAFVLYAFVLAFIIPVPLISFFYFSVIREMAKAGVKKSNSQVKRSKKKVTTMVLSVITLYVVCWLPYWIAQFVIVFTEKKFVVLVFFLNALCYANSSLNPLLYAFLSESFRKNFILLFSCCCADRGVAGGGGGGGCGGLKKNSGNTNVVNNRDGGSKVKQKISGGEKIELVGGLKNENVGVEIVNMSVEEENN